MSLEKKTIILTLGPLHLFWTTGVYYLYELSQKYDVILIAWDSYERDSEFQQVIAKLAVKEIIYIPVGGSLRRNWFLARAFRDISRRRKISLVLQHNHVYEDNLYLQHFIRLSQPDCKRVTYQNGMAILKYHDEDFETRNIFGVNAIVSKYRLPLFLAKRFHLCRRWLLYLANYRIFPLLFAGAVFHPEINVYTGERLKLGQKQKAAQCDYRLFYTKEELQVCKSRMDVAANKCILVSHPLETVGEECNLLIYGSNAVKEENLILVLPSGGALDTMISTRAASKQVVDEVADKWNQVIANIQKIYPGYRIVWKLHPIFASSRVHLDFQNRISQANPILEIADPKSNAQKLIIRSKVVISEASTVLWWAVFLPGKKTVSLDIFGYKGGDEMRYHSGVRYCNNLLEFNKILMEQAESKHERSYPSVTQFLSALG